MWFVDYLAPRELFCVCNFADYVKVPQIWLALVTSDNMQVSLCETLSPGICLTRASVTQALVIVPILCLNFIAVETL